MLTIRPRCQMKPRSHGVLYQKVKRPPALSELPPTNLQLCGWITLEAESLALRWSYLEQSWDFITKPVQLKVCEQHECYFKLVNFRCFVMQQYISGTEVDKSWLCSNLTEKWAYRKKDKEKTLNGLWMNSSVKVSLSSSKKKFCGTIGRGYLKLVLN